MHWLDANSLTRENTFDWELDKSYEKRQVIADKIRLQAIEYRNAVNSKKIGLFDTNNRVWKFIDYSHRLEPKYIKEQIKKINVALYPFKKKEYGLFLTLTASYRDFQSIGETFEWMQRQVNVFLTSFRRLFPVSYVRVSEIQEEHTKNIHFHFLIVGEGAFLDRYPDGDFKSVEKFVKKHWKYFSDLKLLTGPVGKNGKKKSIVGYLVKYITKIFRDDGEISFTMAILWSLGARTWTSSRLDYSVRSKNNSNGGSNPLLPDNLNEPNWIYVGTFSELGLLEGEYSENELDHEILDRLYKRLYDS